MRDVTGGAAMEEARSTQYREVMDKCVALTHGRNLLVEEQVMLFKAGIGSEEQAAGLSENSTLFRPGSWYNTSWRDATLLKNMADPRIKYP
jgi:hypothetical protein